MRLEGPVRFQHALERDACACQSQRRREHGRCLQFLPQSRSQSLEPYLSFEVHALPPIVSLIVPAERLLIVRESTMSADDAGRSARRSEAASMVLVPVHRQWWCSRAHTEGASTGVTVFVQVEQWSSLFGRAAFRQSGALFWWL